MAIIDQFVANLRQVFQPIVQDDSLSPLVRIRRCFESVAARFESNNCSKGCLIGNLALEMSDQNERFRLRLEEALQNWTNAFTALIIEAQQEQSVPNDLNPEMLAENLISSFEGALLRSKVKKSAEPLKNFIHLYFDRFLK